MLDNGHARTSSAWASGILGQRLCLHTVPEWVVHVKEGVVLARLCVEVKNSLCMRRHAA
jgi:hypothetical protein